MKKILALLLAMLLMITLTACAGTNDNGGGKDNPSGSTEPVTEVPAPKTIAEDTNAVTLHFTPPEGYETVNRHFEYAADGTVLDKSFSYVFADESEVMIGYTKGKQITDEIPQSYLDEAEVIEYGGKSFSVITQGATVMGVCQDGDVVYGIGWSFADAVEREKFDNLMSTVSFIDDIDETENGDDLYDIRYTLDNSLNVVSVNNNMTEKPDGTVVDKSITWYYGQDKENTDFRLLIKVHKNKTVAAALPAGAVSKELALGEVTYTAVYEDSSTKPYAYYTQRGDDVYEIRNMGKGGSWSVTRSDESYTALENLMSTVTFE